MKLQVSRDAQHGERCGISLRVSARDPAGFSGRARTDIRLLRRIRDLAEGGYIERPEPMPHW
jgi:hypothetical protein